MIETAIQAEEVLDTPAATIMRHGVVSTAETRASPASRTRWAIIVCTRSSSSIA
jgi:hypothetical protein